MVLSTILENALIDGVVTSFYLQNIFHNNNLKTDEEMTKINLEHIRKSLNAYIQNNNKNVDNYLIKFLSPIEEDSVYAIDEFEKTLEIINNFGLDIQFSIQEDIILALYLLNDFYSEIGALIKNQKVEHLYLIFKLLNQTEETILLIQNNSIPKEYKELIDYLLSIDYKKFIDNKHIDPIYENGTKEISKYLSSSITKYFNTSLQLLEQTTNNIIVHNYIEEIKPKKNKDLHLREIELYDIVYTLNRKDKYNIFMNGAIGSGKNSIIKSLPFFIKTKKINQLKDHKLYLINLEEYLNFTPEDNTKKEEVEHNDRLLNIIFSYFEEKYDNTNKKCILCFHLGDLPLNNQYHYAINKNFEKFMNKLVYFLEKLPLIQTILVNDNIEDIPSYFQKSDIFSTITISSPSKDDLKSILMILKNDYEQYFNVKITEDNILYILSLLSNKENNINNIKNLLDLIYSKAILNKPMTLKQSFSNEELLKYHEINSSSSIESIELDKLKLKLKETVFGQDHVIDSLINKFEICQAGLKEKNKPIAAYMFSGNSGTGKTEVARRLAEFLNVKLLRYDMAEFQEGHSISKLLGSPAGYIGYNEGAPLIKDVIKYPNAVLLFDEIEKANPSVVKLFLHVLEEGTIKGSNGIEVDLSKNIIIFTTNAGAKSYTTKQSGFLLDNQNVKSYEKIKDDFPIEFINRLDDVIYFNELSKENILQIIYKELNILFNLLNKPIKYELTENAIHQLLKVGFDIELGARKIRRVIETEIKLKIAKKINHLMQNKVNIDTLIIDFINNEFEIIINKK